MMAFRRVNLPCLTIIQNRRYFPLWLGQLVSSLGDTLNYIAIVIWAGGSDAVESVSVH